MAVLWNRLLVDFLKLFQEKVFMRLLIDDIITELKLRLEETKGIRNKVLLKDALNALKMLKTASEKKF